MLDDQGIVVRFPVGAEVFGSPKRSYRLWNPLRLVLVPGIKRPGCGASNLTRQEPRIRMGGAVPSLLDAPFWRVKVQRCSPRRRPRVIPNRSFVLHST